VIHVLPTALMTQSEACVSLWLVPCVVQYSVREVAATVGQKLLDLRYVSSSSSDEPSDWMSYRQRIVYALLTIGAVWTENRLDDFVSLTRHISATAHVCTMSSHNNAAELYVLRFVK